MMAICIRLALNWSLPGSIISMEEEVSEKAHGYVESASNTAKLNIPCFPNMQFKAFSLRYPPGFLTATQFSTLYVLAPENHSASNLYHEYCGKNIIDNGLKSSIFFKVDVSLLTRKEWMPPVARKISLPNLHVSTRNRRTSCYFFQ